MKTEEIKSIKIELEGEEADKFKSAIKKIDQENGRIGFGNSADLNSDEIKLIRDLNGKIN
jgi:hypothetical protein